MIDQKNFTWDKRRVFVTGATGLIGPWLIKSLLDKGARVNALIRNINRPSELFLSGNINHATVFEGNIENFSTIDQVLKEQKIEIVFHLASTNLNYGKNISPLPTFETNIRGTYNLLEACRLVRNESMCIVMASSREVYGEQNQVLSKKNMLQARHPYEASKKCEDMICQAYHKTYSLNVSTIRCPNIYGGGDFNWNRIIPGTMRSVIRGKHPIIRSDGTLIRSYIFVLDSVEAFLLVAEDNMYHSKGGKIYNFNEHEPLSTLELVKKIISLSKNTNLKPVVQNTSKDEIRHHNTIFRNTVEDLGWVQNYTLDEGLNETFKWYWDFFKSNVENE